MADSLSDLVSTAAVPANINSSAMNQAASLAQMQAETQQKQVQTQQMQEQLDTSKFNTLMGNMGTLARARPEVAKRLLPQMKDRLQKSGMSVDPGVLDLMASDDSYKQRFNALATGLSGQANDPQARGQFFQAMGDLNEFDKGLDIVEDQYKAKQAADLARATIASRENIAAAKNDTSKENTAANIGAKDRATEARTNPNSPMMVRQQNTANNIYQNTMKGWEGALQSADKLGRTMEDVDLGKINGSKNVRAELQTSIASLLAQGKPATVFGTQSVEQDSLYQHMMDRVNMVLGQSNGTITDAQWKQLKNEVASFRATNAKMHQDAYTSLREGMHPAVVGGLDDRYNKFRSNKGLPGLPAEGDAASGQAPSAPAAQALTPAEASFAKTAADQGYSQQEIDAHLQKMRGK